MTNDGGVLSFGKFPNQRTQVRRMPPEWNRAAGRSASVAAPHPPAGGCAIVLDSNRWTARGLRELIQETLVGSARRERPPDFSQSPRASSPAHPGNSRNGLSFISPQDGQGQRRALPVTLSHSHGRTFVGCLLC